MTFMTDALIGLQNYKSLLLLYCPMDCASSKATGTRRVWCDH